MSNEKRKITYWRLMPKGRIVSVEVMCDVKVQKIAEGREYEDFIDKNGHYHYLGDDYGNYETLDLAVKAAKMKLIRAEASARAALINCEIRRIRLAESISAFALENGSEAIEKANGN